MTRGERGAQVCCGVRRPAPADAPGACADEPACCALADRVRVLLPGACAASAGEPAGPDRCAAPVCCHAPDGDRDLTAGACGEIDGASAEAAPCPPPPEAICCAVDDRVETVAPAACDLAGGGVTDPDDCARPICCTVDLEIVRLARADQCRSQGFVEAAPFACERRICCALDAGAELLDAEVCADRGGVTGADEDCPVCCDGPDGATLTDGAACASAGGRRVARVDCDGPATACCDRQGVPERLAPTLCEAAPLGAVIEDEVCDAPVCCRVGQGAETLRRPTADCLAAGGSIEADDTCAGDVCCVIGGRPTRAPLDRCVTEPLDPATCDAPVCCDEGGDFVVRPVGQCAAPVEAARCEVCCLAGDRATRTEIDDCDGHAAPLSACDVVCCRAAARPIRTAAGLCAEPLDDTACAGGPGHTDAGIDAGALDAGATTAEAAAGCDCRSASRDEAPGWTLALLLLLTLHRSRRRHGARTSFRRIVTRG